MVVALVIAITAVVAIVVLFQFQKRQQLLNKLKAFKGPKPLPVVGNALDLNVPRKDVIDVLQSWVADYGDCVKWSLGLQPYLLITNAEDMEKILSSPVLIEKSKDYSQLYPWLGLGLLTSSGEKWFHRRKQLTPAFHFKILEDFLKVFNEQCQTLVKVLEKEGNKKAFDIFPIITHCALDIICETAMGRPVYAQERSDSDYVKAIYRMSELIQHRQLRPWLHPDLFWRMSSEGKEEKRCLEILHGFTDNVIRERKNERKLQKTGESDTDSNKAEDDIYMNSKKKRLAFLDLLLDAQESDPTLTDKNVREEADTFMFEGHDTTSAAVNWTTFLIAGDSKVQKKVQEELDSIFGSDKERDVTMTDLTQMKYLECCIKEGLRIYPSVPFIARKLTKDLELSNGAVAPASITLTLYFYGLHRNKEVFPDPERFDPDRFVQENAQGRHPFAYVPFSAGPRNCIGQKFAMMEEKVMLATIFRNFNVKQMEKREDVAVLCELITRPENGLKIALEKRK